MIKQRWFALLVIISIVSSCKKEDKIEEIIKPENPASFKETAAIDLGGTAASEIAAYDPASKRLFVVNNENTSKVEVLDLTNYPTINKLNPISFASVSGGANSVAVHNGILAVALEGLNKQDNGKVAILQAASLAEIKQVTVGALPDMVTFSPDGRYIVSANEGEPGDNYLNDPMGSISVIDTRNNYSVKTLDFTPFESQKTALLAGSFRVYGLNASLAKDVEPEYVTISPDSRMAYVTLQENNGVAVIDLQAGTITIIMPLGVKDIMNTAFAMDVSDRDNKMELSTWPVKAYYLPDAIAHFSIAGTAYLALANEGDTRAYTSFNEEVRVSAITLDAARFPNAAALKGDAQLGRLTVAKFNGDTDNDGDYDELYTTGGRSVSIINAATGQWVADIGKDLETRVIAAGKYDDTRSDNKGVEVEAVTIGQVNGQTLAFIGMERSDMIAVYDLANPAAPQFVQLFATGDAPEGVLFIKAKDSPNGRTVLVVSSEEDGMVKFYQPDSL